MSIKTIKTLTTLQQLRQQQVKRLVGDLAEQNQVCQNYQRNIQALSSLKQGSSANDKQTSTAELLNLSAYHSHLEHLIQWQQQALALAKKTAADIQDDLIIKAQKEKILEILSEQKKAEHNADQELKQQKIADQVSLQAWLRQQS